ncbi:dihydrofolate reductase [Cellulophaga sp. E6(2014)]|uniref:dihydrofolate reductase n=1 Tax=Cellulophaga sp. E6(2014) TaxID=1495334 RepID=UPI00051D1EFC|nr:dihydrofolate reductase [Cellulophaga sp. E6(2014)]KGK31835.1 diacylglycerol kinase [Cellulophaga sp. E6(2014)]
MKTVTLIAAAAENNALGKDNDLLWHLPDDFKRFKTLTTGHPIVMGRKTFESFPKPLPNRTHIIITRDKNYSITFENCQIVHSLDAALAVASEIDENIFIIGGGEIYALGLEKATHIELTRVHTTFEADAFFPDFDKNNWELIKEVHHAKDDKHKYDFTYLTYQSKI